jgi:hypothetical protein
MLLAERIGDDVLIDAWCEMKRCFSFLIVDVPASDQHNLFRDCDLTGTPPAFIRSSSSLIEGINPILIPDPELHGPVAQSTLSSMIASALPLLHSKHLPTLPTSPGAPYMRHGPWAE